MALDLTFDAGTLSRLRKAVFDEAAGAGMPNHRAADVVIAVHELAANAVRHGAGAGLLTMRIQAGRLRCQVSDTGPERIDGNAFRTVTTGQPWPVLSGHGLWLVRETADEVTMASGPDGYSVTVLFRLSGLAWLPAAVTWAHCCPCSR